MYRAFFSQMNELSLPLAALGVFLLLFVAVVVRTWVFGRPQDYDDVAQLPLSRGDKS